MKIKNFVKEYQAASEKYCDALCAFLKIQQFTTAGVVDDTNGKGENLTDLKIRKTEQYLFTWQSESLTNVHHGHRLHFLVVNYLKKYAQDLNILDCPISGARDILALKYEPGGFYTWHTDHCAAIPRTFSAILILNDDYEGGELCFREPNGENEIKIENKKGKLILWPSNFMYPHTVKPVTKGTRYSVVTWVI